MMRGKDIWNLIFIAVGGVMAILLAYDILLMFVFIVLLFIILLVLVNLRYRCESCRKAVGFKKVNGDYLCKECANK